MVEKKYLDFCKFYAKFGLLLKQRNVYKGFLYACMKVPHIAQILQNLHQLPNDR